MKKIFLSLLCLMLITGCNINKEEDKKENNLDKDQAIIIEDQVIDNLSFENFNVVIDDDNISHVYFEVVNKSDNINHSSNVIFTIYRDNIEIIKVTKSLNAPIESGDMRIIECSLDINLLGIDKVEYVVE